MGGWVGQIGWQLHCSGSDSDDSSEGDEAHGGSSAMRPCEVFNGIIDGITSTVEA